MQEIEFEKYFQEVLQQVASPEIKATMQVRAIVKSCWKAGLDANTTSINLVIPDWYHEQLTRLMCQSIML